MIIVIEGIDGAGKTQLAQTLAMRWYDEGRATMYFHNGPSEDPLTDYREQALTALRFSHATNSGNVVIDRFNVGEQVYPHTRRDGKPKITPLVDDMIVQSLALLDVRWIIMAIDPVVACERLRANGEDPDITKIWRERDLFVDYYQRQCRLWANNFRLITEPEYSPAELALIATGDWNMN